MNREELCSKLPEAIAAFDFEGNAVESGLYGGGHINDTFAVVTDSGGKRKRYILQRLNNEAFKSPKEVMANIAGVTAFLKEKIVARGGDYMRETLNVIKTHDGENCYIDSIGSFWRAYDFVEGTISYDSVENPQVFEQSAVAFGNFQKLLEDYPATTLFEAIPNFHNTPARFENLQKAIRADKAGRLKDVMAEVEFANARENITPILMQRLESGEIPLRVTHNDTKLNNVLLDAETGKGICVIDLDTVMSGLVANDFGDSIRYGCNPCLEDEKDLSKVVFNLELFEVFTRGFLSALGSSITKSERETLSIGAKLMTFECGMRFLTDYLEGDVYFRTHYPEQNLDRCRTQFKLVRDMEELGETLDEIVNKY